VTRRTTTGGSLLATKSSSLFQIKDQNQIEKIGELFAAGYGVNQVWRVFFAASIP
jgi:hypothetical protein